MKIKTNKGITLISLIITVIIMLILAGVSISMIMGDNSVLKQASKATISQSLSKIKEEFEIQSLGDTIEAKIHRTKSKSEAALALGTDLKKYIPNLPNEYVDKLAIFNGKLVYLSNGATEEEIQIATELGFLTMADEDYKYMFCMYRLSEEVLKHASDPTLIGTKLGVGTAIEIDPRGIAYMLPWYKLTTADLAQFTGLTTEERSILSNYSNFVVKYTTGEVVSLVGKEMYTDTPNELWVYSFNNTGKNGELNLAMEGLLSGINATSIRTANKFGAFSPPSSKANTGATDYIFNNYYNQTYTYETGTNGIILGKESKILSLPIDQKYAVNEKISVNITFKADIYSNDQGWPSYSGPDKKGACLLAISDEVGVDVCSIRVVRGLMKVITFRENGTPESDYTVGNKNGYAIIDISQYNNKYINVNIVAERGKQTKVYINGSLVSTFNSGSNIFTYKTFVIGDLRSGRGMKFIGNVYNFGLYGILLSEEQVAQNWAYTKYQLKTNEAGDVSAAAATP